MLLTGVCASALALALVPLVVILASLRDSGPSPVAVPPLPVGTRPPPSSGEGPGLPPPPPETSAPRHPAGPPPETRALAVDALARMRRAIDAGMAAREIDPRFGTELATQVTTLLNEVDGGTPVDLAGRVARLQAAVAGRAPGDATPARAAGLAALLSDVPIRRQPGREP